MQKQIPQYRVLLREAWRTTWTHKALLVWGFFASLLGSFGEYEIVWRVIQSVGLDSGDLELANGAFAKLTPQLLASVNMVIDWLRNTAMFPLPVFLLSVFLVVGGLYILWLSFTSIIALIAETRRLVRRSSISLADGFKASQKHLGSVIILYTFGKVVVWLLGVLVVLLGLLVVADFWLGLPWLITGFVVLLPLVFATSFVVRFAIVGVVAKEQNMFGALLESMELVRKHWLVTLELALMLMLITFVASFFAVLVIVVVSVPSIVVAMLMFEVGEVLIGQVILAVGISLLMLPIFVAATFIGTYQWVSWTLLYSSLSKRDSLRSKIVRLAERIINNRPLRRKKL